MGGRSSDLGAELDSFKACVIANKASIGMAAAAGAAGVTGRPSGWSSISDQAVARCWLILLASERFRRAYRSLVVADMRQYNDRAGWLLLAWPFMRSVLVTVYLRR